MAGAAKGGAGRAMSALGASSWAARPSSITSTWVPSRNASSMSWVTNRMVMPRSWWMRRISSWSWRRVISSTAPKGSSISRISGWAARALAIPTR